MTREIVEAYLRAFYAGDAEEARRHLADDVSVTGPASRFEDADGFLKAAAHVAAGVSAVRMKKVVVDGADACAFYELEVNHRVGRMAVAERYRLADDKIATIQTIFDMAPFVPSAGKDVAIDPVCKMSVARADAAATRVHDGITYCFCNPGCAEAFERDPAKYLS